MRRLVESHRWSHGFAIREDRRYHPARVTGRYAGLLCDVGVIDIVSQGRPTRKRTLANSTHEGRFPMFELLVAQSVAAVKANELCVSFTEHAYARAALMRLSAHLPTTGRSTRGVVARSTLTFLSGPEGCGKSLLARDAIRNVLERRTKLRYVISSAIEVIELLKLAHERQSLADLLEEFCSLDILVIEDLQEMVEENTSTAIDGQQFLLELIDAALDSGPSVLITSRRLPSELRDLSPRWMSRCHGGLMTTMSFPGVDSRRELVSAVTRQKHIPICEPVDATVHWLAEHWAFSPREIVRSLDTLAEAVQRSGAVVDVPFLERGLMTLGSPNPSTSAALSFDAITGVVATEFHIEPDELRSRSRNQGLIVPRQCAMLLAKELTGQPLETIGQYFGERTHTTVSHCLNRLRELLPQAPTLRQQVQKLRKRLAELRKSDCA